MYTTLLTWEIGGISVKNIGILGCAMITPVSLLQPIKENAALNVYGIAGRDYEKAKVYAERYGISHVYLNYEALLEDKDIDIVYMPLANHVHKEWIIQSAKAKKHILVEKPICLKSSDLEEIQEVCQMHDVQLIEGIMARHHEWQAYVKNLIQTAYYGKLKHIQTNIVFEAPTPEGDSYRTHLECGGGIFWDIASYWVQFLQTTLGLEGIKAYEGKSKFDGPNGCDWDFDAQVVYDNGLVCNLHSGFNTPYEADYILSFEKAQFKLNNMFRPTVGKVKLKAEIIKDNEVEKISFAPSNYYINQLKYLNNVLEGKEEAETITDIAARLQLLEAIYEDAIKRGK